jgi:phosphoribosylanthranilate isomerase
MGRLPFQIKICGVTTQDDAAVAAFAGASAIGLNFYPSSKRFVTLEEASKIKRVKRAMDGLRESEQSEYITPTAALAIIGVFVNHSVVEFTSSHSIVKFDWLQLHGDETPEFVKQVKTSLGLPIMRALRWGRDGSKPIDEYLQQCAAEGCLPDALLIDAHVKGEYGGTGETADWEAIVRWRDSRQFDIPLVLAGGLTPDNVAAAIRTVRPDAVDTASGVESAPGRKDAERVRAFITEAKQAFAALG